MKNSKKTSFKGKSSSGNKNYIFAFVIIVIVIAIIGLSIYFKSSSSQKKLSDKDSIQISLYSNSSTGYKWTYTVDKTDLVDISSYYDDSSCDKDAVGCGGHEVYTIKPLKSGKAVLTFQYSSQHSQDTLTAVYELSIDKNLTITENHYGSYFDE